MATNGEKSSVDESNRMWASASFVGVLIIIGLPLWWKTTEVYRVSLPYDEIASFDPLSHHISSELVVLAYDKSTGAEVAKNIKETFDDAGVIKLNIKHHVLSPKLLSLLDSVAEENEALEEVATEFDLTKPNIFYLVQRKPLFKQVWLSSGRVMFYRDSKASSTISEVLRSWIYQTSVASGAITEAADDARRIRSAPAPAYSIVLSVVHPRPDLMAVEFDAGQIMEDYIGTFVDELEPLHNFTLKSQWIHLLDFDFKPKEVQDKSGRHYAIRQDCLQQLVTRLEERAASRAADAPPLNLVLYATPCHLTPLVIYENDVKYEAPIQAFMSPKWGGVVLDGPTTELCQQELPVWRPDEKILMGAFVAQLRLLLGIVETEPVDGAFLEPLRSVEPRKWEVDALMRLRTLEQVTSAERTLQSLAKLLGEISNIVIDDEVGASIKSSVSDIKAATELCKSGDLVAAMRLSQRAMVEADAAFTAPRLLALLYFPDDQKYAIYIPLFLPIMFPVVLSLKNLILWFRGKKDEKNKEKEKKE